MNARSFKRPAQWNSLMSANIEWAIWKTSMTYCLRPWTTDDEGCDRLISSAIYPEYLQEPLHPSWFPAPQLGAPRETHSRYVAVNSGENLRVAYAKLWETRPRRYRFDLAVRPECQHKGIATQLLNQILEDAQALGATGLQARVRDDKHEALEFAARRGFHESHRMDAYRIHFMPALVAACRQSTQKLLGQGYDITTLAEALEKEPDFVERFHELYSAAREGWPDPDPDPNGPEPIPLDQVRLWLDQMRLPGRFFIAKHGQRYVGFTSFFGIGTAVHPEYRRQGIATRLKARSIVDAHERGLEGQTTSTASPAMRKVFERLGYRRIWSEIRLLRPL